MPQRRRRSLQHLASRDPAVAAAEARLYKAFQRALCTAREAQHVSYRELARRMGHSVSMGHDLLVRPGCRSPTLRTLARAALALDIEFEDVISRPIRSNTEGEKRR